MADHVIQLAGVHDLCKNDARDPVACPGDVFVMNTNILTSNSFT